MKLPNEKHVYEEVNEIKNKYTKSIEHMKDKLKKIDDLEKECMRHLHVCNRIREEISSSTDQKFKNQIIHFDSNQRKKIAEFDKHYNSLKKCRERMMFLLKQVNIEREETTAKIELAITNGQQALNTVMMDIIKDEAYTLAKKDIKNVSDKK